MKLYRLIISQTGPSLDKRDVLVQAEWSDSGGPHSQRITETMPESGFEAAKGVIRATRQWFENTLVVKVQVEDEKARLAAQIAVAQARLDLLNGS